MSKSKLKIPISTANIKKYLLPNLPYLFIFWFANKLGVAYRLASGDNMLSKLSGITRTLNMAMASIVPSFIPFDLLVGVAGAAIIYAVVYFKGKNARKYRKNVEYGSARWGNAEDIKPYIDPKPENNVILTQTESITMNSRPSQPKYARNKNVLIMGGSGSGKTRFWLKPNLMQLHSSYCVTDPKGTILVECGKLLERNGYKIKVLNTIDFAKSMRYNPFAYIRNEKDILKFVTAFIANTKGEGKSSDDFWVKAETLLYTALIGYIHYEAPDEERNMNTLVEMINAMEVKEDDENFRNSIDFLFEALEERAPQHFAVRQYKKYRLAAGLIANDKLIGKEYWTKRAVTNMLTDRVYVGDMVQGKTQTIGGKQINISPNEWITVKNTHEPIISREMFDNVQHLRTLNSEKDKASRCKAIPYAENIFGGKIICAKCGYPMRRKRQNKDNVYWYRCESQHIYSKNACVQVSVREADLIKEVLELLHRQAEVLCGRTTLLERQADNAGDEAVLRSISQNLDKDGRMLKSLYESMVGGIITADEFVLMKAEYEAKIEALTRQADRIRNNKYETASQAAAIRNTHDAVNAALRDNKLTAEIISLLVDKILVNPDKSFEIVLNFQDEYRRYA